MNIITMIITFVSVLLGSTIGEPDSTDQTPYEMLSSTNQRYIDKIAKHYWLDPDGDIWCSQIADEGVSVSKRMSKEIAAERTEAFESSDAPLWYCVSNTIRRRTIEEVREFIAMAWNLPIYDQRRAFGEANGLDIKDRCLVVAAPKTINGGFVVRFIVGGILEDERHWLSGHPVGNKAVVGDIYSIDAPLRNTPFSARYEGEVIYNYELVSGTDLNKDFPLHTPSDIVLEQLTAERLAEELWNNGIEKLPVWKMVRVKVRDATPGHSTYMAQVYGLDPAPKPAVYGWIYKLSAKRIRFKETP